MTTTVDDFQAVKRLIEGLSDAERKQVEALVGHELQKKWLPNPGPQTEAYYSKADCLLYGGEPGGGKSQLILGLAFNEHQRSFIMRREYGDLERLIEDALAIHGSRSGFNGSPPPRLRLSNERTIYFRAAHRIGDEQGTMGQGRDLLGVDEACQFAESQVRFLMGWVRTETAGQRCRTVLATNPPLTADGLWVTRMFAPWLDEHFPKPARPGELRWVVSDEEGNDQWVDGPDDVKEINGKTVHPTSRTYIPASVRDNPYYVDTAYQRTLDAMQEPHRSLLMGGFKTQFRDADFQVIPTAWIKAAQERWKPDGWKSHLMTAMALDPAGGGRDFAELAYRHGGWFGELISEQGPQTADGTTGATTIIRHRRNDAALVVDVGGGYASGVTVILKENGIAYQPFNGAAASAKNNRDGIGFVNKRAEAWWGMREALDPSQEGGSPVALPPDQEVLADLATPTWTMKPSGILIESKEDIKKRLGRSPGKGDAIVMCLSEGNRAAERKLKRNKPKVILGYTKMKGQR